MPVRSIACIILTSLSLAIPQIGCRKEPVRSSFEGDMGSDGVILLPTDSTWVNERIAKGQAEWQPFRKPEEQPPEDQRGGDDDATAPQDEGGDVEKTLREFITAYNDVVKETTADDVDALLDYYVDEQREVLRPVFEVVAAVIAADAELRAELEKQLADAPDRLTSAETALAGAAPYLLTVSSFSEVTDTTANADLAPGSLFDTCSFVLLDQDWYLKTPEGDAPDRAQQAVEAALATRQGWVDALKADPPELASVLKAIEEAASANKPESGDAASTHDEPNAPNDGDAANDTSNESANDGG